MSTLKASKIQPQSDSDPLIVSTNATERLRIDTSGNVGVGTSSPKGLFEVSSASANPQVVLPYFVSMGRAGGDYPAIGYNIDYRTATNNTTGVKTLGTDGASHIEFYGGGFILRTGASPGGAGLPLTLNERMRIKQTGEVGIGTSSPVAKLDVRGTVSVSDKGTFPTSSAGLAYNRVYAGGTAPALILWDDGSSVAAGRYSAVGLGSRYNESSTYIAGGYIHGGNEGTTDHSGFLRFNTTPADGSANVERMRINSSGYVGIGTTDPQTLLHVKGASVFIDGHTIGNSTSNVPLYLRYKGSASIGGTFLVFQANTAIADGTYNNNNYPTGDNVGSIVCSSGGVLTYNTFCGSHWSSIVDGNDDILPGTVLQSVGETNGNHLPKTKISDTPNSTAVYGVFYGKLESGICVASLGAYFIRIAANATVSIGDLLVSDGTGCAVPQQDDLIRSRTIGKVTSAIPLETYEDGSYTVPAVLYCG